MLPELPTKQQFVDEVSQMLSRKYGNGLHDELSVAMMSYEWFTQYIVRLCNAALEELGAKSETA